MQKAAERRRRAQKIVAHLKKAYPAPKSELRYRTPFQFLVAVVLSAQCTDKLVNKVTEPLFRTYRSASDFAAVADTALAKEISQVSFYRTKAKHIVEAAKLAVRDHRGRVPRNAADLQKLPGVGYKTAHVILGELYEVWEGIPTDTHVKRFARKFDLTYHVDLKNISHDLEALIPKKDWKYVNNGLVLYGRYICKANRHDCSNHALTKIWPPAAHKWPTTSVKR